MEEELYLTDLIDVDTLQRMQDAFSALTGMAALTTDARGIPVTVGSNFTDFCTKHIRKSSLGHLRCEECDRYGAEVTWQRGGPACYTCHAGMIDYAAPILANGHMVGSFIGGQVQSVEFERDNVYRIARELDIEPEELWEAAQKVHVLEQEEIDKAAQSLYTMANVLSDMAYGKFIMWRANAELERAVNMKSDFLANVSHEIRTPMNSILGMTEMALREDLPPAARDYMRQIKSASRALLTIINDVLDFSKIESGKMDIVPVEYEAMSIVNDVSNIVQAGLKDKPVELILDIAPDIPYRLFGDNVRIKQILLNLANNATKFTAEGFIVIKMSCEYLTGDQISLQMSVQDTGIGIKQEDMPKLFRSFQQLDSKRNRNIEGTGLGLAISRQLTELMGGEINVKSEYGRGSSFSFNVIQNVVDGTPACGVQNPDALRAMGLIQNPRVRRQLIADCKKLGVKYHDLEAFTPLNGQNTFLFVEENLFTEQVREFVENNPDLTPVLLIDFDSTSKLNMPNLLVVKKPLYTLNESLIFNRQGLHGFDGGADSVNIDFVAPKAEVLIVDDNSVNLTVTKGLLDPLQMQVETCLSGQEAIARISTHHYDLIFMDHMMPELDGVETTHIIRRFHPEYDDVPIIALTANAIGGVKEMFLREGMNDFIAKPIELKELIVKVRQWLPVEKIKKSGRIRIDPGSMKGKKLAVGDLDTHEALRLCGSEDLFWKVLKDYYRVIERKCALIKDLEEREEWPAYTIEVHALKSASKQIGAMSLSEKAAALERAGNARDSRMIHERTDEMLKQYREYLPILEPFCKEEESEETIVRISEEQCADLLNRMGEAVEELDLDGMEEVVREMSRYSYEEEQQEMFDRLREAVEDVDVEVCESILGEWKKLMK